MSAAGWVALAASLAVVLAAWIAFTASRLDRLHARLDAAQSALDAQLVRRVAALRHVADTVPTPAPVPVLAPEPAQAPVLEPAREPVPGVGPPLSADDRARLDAIALVALTAAGPDRQEAENQVGRALAELAGRRVPLSTAQREELHESAVRVSIARRFYNDAVRDTRALRGRRMPRLLHLAGRRELPQYFNIDDTVPQELGTP